jgi:uncharacterized protein involved in exopolysaccharide biosynthesis
MSINPKTEPDQSASSDESLLEFLLPFVGAWRRLLVVPLLAGILAVALSFLVPKTYQASTSLLLQQQQSSAAASALASLGALGALAGVSGGRNSSDTFVALMQSANATDQIIDEFDLLKVYDVPLRWQARDRLAKNTSISIGKKDGLIHVAVIDHDPSRAAAIANRYVDKLRRLTNELSVSEAQGRRVFFEGQLHTAQERLIKAQLALQASGFTQEAMKAEPKAAGDAYAKLQADLMAAELRLQSLRGSFADGAPEVRALQQAVDVLRTRLAKTEKTKLVNDPDGSDYVSLYREFKYQETLYEVLARQFELARVDESRDGAVIQVLDKAVPPERKLTPKRSLYGLGAWAVCLLLMAAWIQGTATLERARVNDPVAYGRWQRFLSSF